MAKGDSEEGTGIRGNSFAAHSALSGVGLEEPRVEGVV